MPSDPLTFVHRTLCTVFAKAVLQPVQPLPFEVAPDVSINVPVPERTPSWKCPFMLFPHTPLAIVHVTVRVLAHAITVGSIVLPKPLIDLGTALPGLLSLPMPLVVNPLAHVPIAVVTDELPNPVSPVILPLTLKHVPIAHRHFAVPLANVHVPIALEH
eukprot:CAMPEP_0195650724 /NCGR_PEP_ID=MMETSP0815-20121206/31872_1 /TAXON_ID=97485 /ORGANISM="Prymnesium parvum, Strain Texoma1" /LENGTH=158 /DNA_ID=CAMNT_0040794553 /DNA_START=335 /DNA_END=812 /DNA_ORIENTATION=-